VFIDSATCSSYSDVPFPSRGFVPCTWPDADDFRLIVLPKRKRDERLGGCHKGLDEAIVDSVWEYASHVGTIL
jgi:hypothetical protein